MKTDSQKEALDVAVIHALIVRLVKCMRRPSSPPREASASSLVQLCMRILASRMEPKSTDVLYVGERIGKKILQNHGSDVGPSLIKRFQQLQGRLIMQTVVQKKGELLYLMYSLMDSANKTFSNSMDTEQLKACISKMSHRSSHDASTNFTRKDTGFEVDLSKIQSEVKANLGSTKTGTRLIPRRTTSLEVPEEVLIRELLYCFQGISSKYIFFNNETDSFEVSNTIGVPRPMRDLICMLSELGWLYSRVTNYVERHNCEKTFGVMGQSFCHALQSELSDYYRLIAILEAQVENDLHGDTAGNRNLTLRRLTVWTQDPLERIRFMACLVESVEGTRGGALASAVYRHMQHGDPFRKAFVGRMMKDITTPLFLMIHRWVFEGELDDPRKEFFVSADTSFGDTQLWQQKYGLNHEMLPTFISRELGNKILVIGKSINFIRQCCDDTEWVMDAVSDVMCEAETLEFVDMARLETVITEVSMTTNKYLTKVLLNKYRLLHHCRAMKQYLLLGQGDFIQFLMDLLSTELSKQASKIYRHNLVSVLEAALNSSNAKFEDPEILGNLDVKLQHASPHDDGWAIFALHYKLQSPLNTVIDDSAMNEYLKIFRFLWKLTRIHHVLSHCWNANMNMHHLAQRFAPELKPIFHQGHLLRSEMIHFTSNLHNYMMFEVLETSWHKLVEDLKSANDLDALINSHSEYLFAIKKKALLLEESHQLLAQLNIIFDIILQFYRVQDSLYADACNGKDRILEQEHLIKERTKQGGWGIHDDEEMDDFGVNTELVKQLLEIGENYRHQFHTFLELLKNGRSESENLRFLTYRLDFNEYYSPSSQIPTCP